MTNFLVLRTLCFMVLVLMSLLATVLASDYSGTSDQWTSAGRAR